MTERQSFFLRHLAQTSPSPLALDFEKAEGIYLYSTDNKKYIDFISGISTSNTGHRHPHVVKAIQEQLDRYMHLMVYGEYIQTPQLELFAALKPFLPANLSSVYFVNSGSEAIEGALKLAKRVTGRSVVCSFNNAYHGSSHGAMSLMGNEDWKRAFRPLLPGHRHLRFNREDDLDQITPEVAAVVAEPIQAEAGVVLPENDFLKKLRKRCSETGTLLILDEIQTGMGRTGQFFAHTHFGIEPDILCLAKGLGGGLPLGAFLAPHDLMNRFSHDPVLGHITTFGGNAVCCKASLASIEVIVNEGLMNRIPELEQQIRSTFIHPLIREIRGKGLLLALELESTELNMKVISKAVERGLIIDWFLFNDHSIRLAPPLTITPEQIGEAWAILEGALNDSQ